MSKGALGSKTIRPHPPHEPPGQGGAARGGRPPTGRANASGGRMNPPPPLAKSGPTLTHSYAGAPKAVQSKRASGKTPAPASFPAPKPVAPPIYRPQMIPKVLQTKTATGRQQQPPPAPARNRPAPPPVYRPQPAPKVLQLKGASGAREAAEHKAPARSPHAPAVYRPQTPPRVCQLKSAGVGGPSSLPARQPKPPAEAKLGSVRALPRAVSPAATRVIQRSAMSSSARDDQMDLMEDLVHGGADEEFIAAMFPDKKMGQTYGSKESKDDEDDDWLPPGIHVRPPKPGALWKAVYSATACEDKAADLWSIACAERADGKVYMFGKGRKECDSKGALKGGGKKPPVCHKFPYNHLMWAWRTIAARQNYKGPAFTVSGAPTDQTQHADLAWGNLGNLQPGHAACNSMTAGAATGVPSDPGASAILKYVEGWCKGKSWIP